jgi:tight adherence protein C
MQAFVAKHFDEKRFGIDGTLRGKMRREFVRAGYFRSDALNYYLFWRAALAIGVPLIAYIGVGAFLESAPWYQKLFVVGVATALGIIGPDIYLDRRQKALAARYRLIFPEFLDLIMVCIDAGLSLEAALDRVTAEMVKKDRLLGLNLMMMAAEMRAGRSTIDALDLLADRLAIDEARSLVVVLRQSISLGSDVGETLRVFSDEMRDRRILRAEERANKLPVKLSLPLGLFIFPMILLLLLFPVALRVLAAMHLKF